MIISKWENERKNRSSWAVKWKRKNDYLFFCFFVFNNDTRYRWLIFIFYRFNRSLTHKNPHILTQKFLREKVEKKQLIV